MPHDKNLEVIIKNLMTPYYRSINMVGWEQIDRQMQIQRHTERTTITLTHALAEG